MPANKKYLIQSPWTQTSKIIAAILGGFIASMLVHISLALWFDKITFVTIGLYGIILLWMAFMMLVYWIKKPWKSWAIILAITAISGIAIYLEKM